VELEVLQLEREIEKEKEPDRQRQLQKALDEKRRELEILQTALGLNRPRIPDLGLAVQDLTMQLAQYFGVSGGILVREVRPESPAASAGLRAGDIILRIDQSAIGSLAEFESALFNAALSKRGSLTIGIHRNREPLTVTVALTGKP
jgi:S1-C subfamily serine protease